MFDTIKQETINLFNGTTIKKMFTFFQGNDIISDDSGGPLTSLIEYVEQLKQTIASSKIFIGSIIDKIRHQGKIQVVNKLNDNPKHPEFESSFPDLLTVTHPEKNENDFYPFKSIDEEFDFQGKKITTSNKNKTMLNMDQSNQKLHDRNFLIDQHSPWQVSKRSNSIQNIVNTTRDFQKSYQLLKQSTELDSQFMQDVYSSLVIVDEQLIPNTNKTEMIAQFKKYLPNVNAQKFISTYANEKFLNRSYLQLISEHPEIQNYQLNNSRNIYTISTFKDGSIKLVATNLSDMHVKNSNYTQKYKSLGIRATVIMLKNEFPIIKYSHFMQ